MMGLRNGIVEKLDYAGDEARTTPLLVKCQRNAPASILRDDAWNFVILAEGEGLHPVTIFPVTVYDSTLKDRHGNCLAALGHGQKA